MKIFGLLFLLLVTGGCVSVKPTPSPTGVPPTEAVAIAPFVTRPAEKSVTKVDLQAAKSPAKVPAAQRGKYASAKPSSDVKNMKAISPPLDLKALETRLKETKAIGVFTKITLKNQVDDLLNQFQAYYHGQAKTTLAELRQSYNLLLLKVLSLLQNDDPELAHAIVTSREAIWGILADPAKFATLNQT
ncbi:MAG: hypothetical protein ACYC9L_07510 [Sulfuricaulis sp.]